MILPDTKVKKISEFIYQNAEVPKDGSRPLEWRKSLNTLSLKLKNLEVVTYLNTHEKDWTLKDTFKETPLKLIKPDISTRFAIKAVVAENEMKDRIYCLEPLGDAEMLTLVRPRGPIYVHLGMGKAHDGGGKFPDGGYLGSCLITDNSGGNEGVHFTLSAPEDQIHTLINNLKDYPDSTLNICVELFSFSYEVGAFFFDPYHFQDFFIEENTDAFIKSMSLSTDIGSHTVHSDEEEGDEEEYWQDEVVKEHPISAERVAHTELLQALHHLEKPMHKVVMALWVLIIVVVLAVLF